MQTREHIVDPGDIDRGRDLEPQPLPLVLLRIRKSGIERQDERGIPIT